MSSSQRLVTRNFLTLGSGEVFARIVAFAATIYLAHQLGADGLGVVAFATAVVLYLSRIADAGVDLGLGVREIAAYGDRSVEIVGPILALRIALSLGMVVTFGLGAYLLLPEPEGLVVAIYSLTLIVIGCSTRWVHVGLEKTTLVAFARTAGELIMVIGVVVFVADISDIVRVPMAQLAGDAFAAIVLAVALARTGYRLAPRWRAEIIRPLAARAMPFVASTLLGLMIYNADLIFLRGFRDTATVGYYAAAYALIGFLLNVGYAYFLSLLPALTRLEGEPAAQQALYETSAAHCLAATLPIAAGGFLLAPQIIALMFGPQFGPSGPVLQILIVSIPFSIVRDVPIGAIMSRGREDLVLWIVGGSAVANLVLNTLLIPPLGMTGAAIATVSTEALRLLLAEINARRLGFATPSPLRGWRPAIATLAMVGAILASPADVLWLNLPLGATAYAAALALVGGVKLTGSRPELNV